MLDTARYIMPPRRSNKMSNKKKAKEVELTDTEKKWQALVDKQQNLLKEIETYMEDNKIDLLKNKLGGKKPTEEYQLLLRYTIKYKKNTEYIQLYNNPLELDKTYVDFSYGMYSYYRCKLSEIYRKKCIKKEASNLYYNRRFGCGCNDLTYYMLFYKYIENSKTANDIITEIIKLLLHCDYSLDNIIVKIDYNTNFTPDNGFAIHGMTYRIYLYDPNSATAKKEEYKPIPLSEAKRLDNLAYNTHRENFKLNHIKYKNIYDKMKCNGHNEIRNTINANLDKEDKFEPVTRYVRAEDFFEDLMATDVEPTTTTDYT